MRDAFTSFFFVSIGMLLDVNFLLQNPGFIVLLTLGVIALKAVIGSFAIALIGLPLRIIILVGLVLSQIGEFSFVLSQVGLSYGLLSSEVYQIFLDVTVLTIAATSFIIGISPSLADLAMRLPIPLSWKTDNPSMSNYSLNANTHVLEDHLIIVGYGVNGRNVAKSAKSEEIPYVVIDIDPDIVKREAAEGEPISYGDATQEPVLLHVGIIRARVIVIAISERTATRRITDLARRLNPDIYIIARTRYIQEMKTLHDLGASEVVPEEYETSVEIFSRVLEKYDVPRDRIESFTEQVRSDGYEMFRSLSKEPYCDSSISLMSDNLVTFKVEKESPLAGNWCQMQILTRRASL